MAGSSPQTPDGPPGPAPAGAALYSLLALLPDLRVLGGVREALLVASQDDATRRWDRDRSYDTLDHRVLDPGRVQHIARTVAQEESARIGRLLRGVGAILESWAAGRPAETVRLLGELAAELQEGGRHFEAVAFLEVALRESSGLADPVAEGALCRSLAKSCWRLGRLDRAVEMYGRARQIFRQAGDRTGEIVALQGLGNVRAAQGRWQEAQGHHVQALDLCGEEDLVLAGQLCNNLSQVTRRRGRLDEADGWQERAEGTWARVGSPVDRVIARNNAGLLHLARGRVADARDVLLEGLSEAVGELQKAALLVNLAQVEVRAADLDRAEHLAREAEEFAILAGATDLLIETYTVLGVVWRERGSDQGITFFEKALELARDGRFPMDHARAHVEYGRFRRRVGDDEEALGHFEAARAIYRELGATVELEELGGDPA